MVANVILILCAQGLVAKFALSQFLGPGSLGAPCRTLDCDGVAPVDCWGCGGRFGYRGYGGAGFGMNPSCGGNLMVTSSSSIAPTGLRVTSKNIIEGTLAVIGNLPFLGAVVTDGAFPSAGAGSVSYGCGDGSFGITAENINIPPAVAPIVPRIGYSAGIPAYNLPYGRGLLFRYRGGSGVY